MYDKISFHEYNNKIFVIPQSINSDTYTYTSNDYYNGTYSLYSTTIFSMYGVTYSVFKMFDINTANQYRCASYYKLSGSGYFPPGNVFTGKTLDNTYFGEYFTLSLPYSFPAVGYTISSSILTYCPKSWVLYGSTNGTTWVLLDTQINQSPTVPVTYTFSNSVSYNYYGFVITSTNNPSTTTLYWCAIDLFNIFPLTSITETTLVNNGGKLITSTSVPTVSNELVSKNYVDFGFCYNPDNFTDPFIATTYPLQMGLEYCPFMRYGYSYGNNPNTGLTPPISYMNMTTTRIYFSAGQELKGVYLCPALFWTSSGTSTYTTGLQLVLYDTTGSIINSTLAVVPTLGAVYGTGGSRPYNLVKVALTSTYIVPTTGYYYIGISARDCANSLGGYACIFGKELYNNSNVNYSSNGVLNYSDTSNAVWKSVCSFSYLVNASQYTSSGTPARYTVVFPTNLNDSNLTLTRLWSGVLGIPFIAFY